MRLARLAPLPLLAALAAPAWGACFTVYDRANLIVYRSTMAPIDLSGPISAVLPARFPGGHLVISTDVRGCTTIEPTNPVDPLAGIRPAIR